MSRTGIQMAENTVWAPNWKTTVGVSIVLFGLAVFAPRPLAAGIAGAIGGAIGGAVGGAIGFIIDYTVRRNASDKWLFGRIMLYIGLAIGFIFEKGSDQAVSSLSTPKLDPLFIVHIVAGISAGAICGLMPQLLLNTRNQKVGNISYWVCIVAGALFGIMLALPTSVASYAYGRYGRKATNPDA